MRRAGTLAAAAVGVGRIARSLGVLVALVGSLGSMGPRIQPHYRVRGDRVDIGAATGELLRELVLDPTKRY